VNISEVKKGVIKVVSFQVFILISSIYYFK